MAVQRRDVLAGAGALLVAQMASAARAEEHKHQQHTLPPKTNAVFDTAIACEVTGELCIDHCFETFKKGDVSLAGCAESVNEMMAVNQAVQRLAAMNSPRLNGVARAALPVYENCREQCEKHAGMHEICKKCMESCENLEKAVTALTA